MNAYRVRRPQRLTTRLERAIGDDTATMLALRNYVDEARRGLKSAMDHADTSATTLHGGRAGG